MSVGLIETEREDDMQRIRTLASTAALLLCLGPGCEDDKTSYCEEKIDCEQGTQEDLDSCMESIRSEYEMAEACGCMPLYEDWIACMNETSTCELTGWHYSDSGTWEKDPDSLTVWIADESCTQKALTLHDCELDSGLDPEHGGECGG